LTHRELLCVVAYAHAKHRCSLTHRELLCVVAYAHAKHRCSLTHRELLCVVAYAHAKHRCSLTHRELLCVVAYAHAKHRCILTHREHWRHQLLEHRRALRDALLLLLAQAQQRCYSCMPLLAGLGNAFSSLTARQATALQNMLHSTQRTCTTMSERLVNRLPYMG
jgi:hypothetical protein